MNKEELTRELESLKKRVADLEVYESEYKDLQKRFESLFVSSPIGLYIVQDGCFVAVSTEFERISGYSENELIGKHSLDLVLPGDRDMVRENAVKVLKKEPSQGYEYRVVAKSGETKAIFEAIVPIQYQGKRAVLGNFMDITERRQAEERLRATEQNFHNSMDDSPMGIRIFTTDGETLYANKAILEIFGYDSFEEFKAVPRSKLYTPEGYIETMQRRELLKLGKLTPNYDVDIVRKDGEVRHLTSSRKAVIWNGETQLQTISQDITERKKTEELLKQSGSRLKLAIDTLESGIWELNAKTGKAWRSLRHDQIFGYTTLLPEWTYQMFLDHVVPEDRSEVDSKYGYALSTNTGWDFECRIRRVDNTVRWIHALGKPSEYDDKNEVVLISGIVRDITVRRQIEEMLKESEQRYRTLFESAAEGILIADNETKKLKYANPAICTMLGYTQEELTKMGVDNIHPKASLEHAIAEFDSQARGEKILSSLPCLKKDGNVIITDINATKAIIDGRECSIGFFTDITERKKAEESLKQASEEWQTTFDSITSLVSIQDKNCRLVKVNKAYADVFKKKPEELVGKLCFEIVHGANKSIQNCPHQETLRTQKPFNSEFFEPSLGIYIEVSTSPIFNDIGTLIGSVHIVQNITERKKTEELIQASLKEKETLLKEVHHRVKNNMQVISSLLRLQAGKVKDKDALAMLKDSQNRIQSMALVYNKLYQSHDLARIDMADYIKELTLGLIKSYTTNPNRITASIDPSGVFLGVDMAIPCGLVINELVTNSLKYAFPENRTGQIAISLKEDSHQEVELVVSDNGVGIPEGIILANASTLGLKLVTNLVENQLGGKIELDRTQGMTFKITFSQAKEGK